MRIGQVDDFTLHETTLKPRIEQFTRDRVAWLKGAEGAEQHYGNYYHKAPGVGVEGNEFLVRERERDRENKI